MSAIKVKINPPQFSKRQTRRKGLDDLASWAKGRLSTDLKQFKHVKSSQIEKDSEVGCYYEERVQLLRDFIAKIDEAANKYPKQIDI